MFPTRRVLVFALPCLLSAQTVSLTKKSETFERAQITAWVQPDRLAVARWDGTLSIFRQPKQGEYGPVLTQAVTVPSLKPIEAIIPISADVFATSNGDTSLTLWKAKDGSFSHAGNFAYDAGVGVAESGAVITDKQQRLLVSGHAEGFIVVWRVDGDRLRLVRKVSPYRGPSSPCGRQMSKCGVVSDLLEHRPDQGRYQSSSELKAIQLPKIFQSRPADLLISVGTAAFPDPGRSQNGNVTIGTRVFLHNRHPNGENPDSNWQDGPV